MSGDDSVPDCVPSAELYIPITTFITGRLHLLIVPFVACAHFWLIGRGVLFQKDSGATSGVSGHKVCASFLTAASGTGGEVTSRVPRVRRL